MFWISLLVLAKLKFQVWLNSDMFELRYRVSVQLARVGSARVTFGRNFYPHFNLSIEGIVNRMKLKSVISYFR